MNIDPATQHTCQIEFDIFTNFLEDFLKPSHPAEVIDRSTPQNIDSFPLKQANRSLQHPSNLRKAAKGSRAAEKRKHDSSLMEDELLKSYNFILRTGEIEASCYHTIFKILPKGDDL